MERRGVQAFMRVYSCTVTILLGVGMDGVAVGACGPWLVACMGFTILEGRHLSLLNTQSWPRLLAGETS